ncbi:MAG: sulfotransferase [Myxococcota bacterium]
MTSPTEMTLDAMKAGRWRVALEQATRACACEPRSPTAWHLKGLASLESGLIDEAVASLQQALRLAPGTPRIRGPLGVALLKQGHLDDAGPHLDAAAGDAWVDLHRGVLAVEQGRSQEAVPILQEALRRHPSDTLGLRYLGLAALQTGQLDVALRAWRSRTRLCPDDPRAQIMLGVTRERIGDGPGAVEAFRAALTLQPDNRLARQRLAARLIEQGELREATWHYQRMNNAPEARAGMALIAERMGELERAITLAKPLVAQPKPPITALEAWGRAQLRRGTPQHALAPVRNALHSQRPNHQRRVLLHLLGDLLDKMNDVDGAWDAWETANNLLHARFDADQHDLMVDQICTVWTKKAPCAPIQGPPPIFIVGMPRSGTSLLERMLDAHPNLTGIGEHTGIPRAAQLLGGPAISSHQAAEVATALRSQIGVTGRFVDKMPHNFYHLGLIRQLFPNARVLYITRDVEDVALSCFRQRFGPAMAYTASLDGIAAVHRAHLRLMHHWAEQDVLPIHTVRYADLVSDPEAKLREILAFVGERWNPDCLDFHRSTSVVATASYAQVRRPVYRSSIGRAARYRHKLRALRQQIRQTGVA